MRYQETHLWVFRSVKEDGAVERVFVDPHDSMRVVVTLLRPEAAAYASSDGGASWTRASIPLDVPDADQQARAALVRPRLLAEVLFDARDGPRLGTRPRPGLPHRGRRPHLGRDSACGHRGAGAGRGRASLGSAKAGCTLRTTAGAIGCTGPSTCLAPARMLAYESAAWSSTNAEAASSSASAKPVATRDQ
jgi:hypothetical protein